MREKKRREGGGARRKGGRGEEGGRWESGGDEGGLKRGR